MKPKILEELKKIEIENDVSIILAIESGSRAWGFPSEDSDYDVRFIYAHKTDWYLSVFEKRDVIELPIDPVLDINGWDIKKAFGLLRKSNPALLEWLSSPIVYSVNSDALSPLLDLSKKAFLPESSGHHYISMAKGNMKKILHFEEVKIKAYLYSLRPILCCKWVIKYYSQPPIIFDELLNEFLPGGSIRVEIEKLLKVKKSSIESDTISTSSIINSFLIEEINILENAIPKNRNKYGMEIFDMSFRQTLEKLASNANLSV